MALFLQEHHFSPGGGLRCRSARFVPQRRVKVSWGWWHHAREMWSSRCWHGKEELFCAPGAWQRPGCGWQRWMLAPCLEERVSLCVSFSPGASPLCIYVGKEIHEVFILHLPMQKCRGQSFFLSVFFLTEEGVVVVSWMHACRGSNDISNAISRQMQKPDNILKPSLWMHLNYHQTCT